MKEVGKIVKELKKLAWGVALIGLAIAGMYWTLGSRSAAERAIDFVDFIGLHPRECTLCGRFRRAVASRDLDKAEKIFQELQSWEAAYNAKEEKRCAKRLKGWPKDKFPRPFRPILSCASPQAGAILYEKKGEWSAALFYLDEAVKINAQVNDGLIDRFDAFKGEDVRPTRARVHYKVGDYANAFVDFCDLAPPSILDPAALSAALPRCIDDCFTTYDDFLQFMETQYLKLGRPEEYREAMDAYRTLNKVGT